MASGLVAELRKSIRDKRTYERDFIYLVGDNAIAKGKGAERFRAEYMWGKQLRKKASKSRKCIN